MKIGDIVKLKCDNESPPSLYCVIAVLGARAWWGERGGVSKAVCCRLLPKGYGYTFRLRDVEIAAPDEVAISNNKEGEIG